MPPPENYLASENWKCTRADSGNFFPSSLCRKLVYNPEKREVTDFRSSVEWKWWDREKKSLFRGSGKQFRVQRSSFSSSYTVMMMSCIALVKRSFIHSFYSVMERIQFPNSVRSRFPEGSCCFYFHSPLSLRVVLYRALKMSGTKSSWNNSQFSTHERCHILDESLSRPSLFISDNIHSGLFQLLTLIIRGMWTVWEVIIAAKLCLQYRVLKNSRARPKTLRRNLPEKENTISDGGKISKLASDEELPHIENTLTSIDRPICFRYLTSQVMLLDASKKLQMWDEWSGDRSKMPKSFQEVTEQKF